MRIHKSTAEKLTDKSRRWRIAKDVRITPSDQLPEEVRTLIVPDGKLPPDKFGLERDNARALPKLVNKNVVDVLNAFGRQGAVYGDVLDQLTVSTGAARDAVDGELQPLVVTLIHNNFLIEVDEQGNASAEMVEASLHAGDHWGDYIIRENVKIMIDSEIHKVEHSATGVVRALKVMQRRFPNQDMKDVIARRLTHEFSVIARIHHPNVVRLWESGEYDGRVYGILDYADGSPVRSFAYENGKTPDDATLLECALQCSVALGAVHEAGYLHGDVHTGNFLVKDGCVCLIDFGLARPVALPEGDEKKYAEGGVVLYMPPEYVRHSFDKIKGFWCSVASEVYSCGVILFSLLTRRYPYQWTAFRKDYMKKILEEPPLSFEACERLPWPEMEAVLRRALAKSPEDRFVSMAEFHHALKDVAPSAVRGVDPFQGKTGAAATPPDEDLR